MGRPADNRNPLVDRPSLARMLGRAVRLRCPWCGGRGWRKGWIGRYDRCQTCGYRYERQDGFSLGATTINMIVTLGVLAAVSLGGVLATYPDIATLPIAAAGVLSCLVLPVVLYPFSYTVWAAIDLLMRPLEPPELADAAAAVASGEVPGPRRRGA